MESCAEFDEDPVHIAEVGGIAMREEHGEAGPWVTHVHGDDLRAPPRPHPPRLHAHTPPDAGQSHPPRRHFTLNLRRRRGIRPLSGTRRLRRRRLLLVDHAVRRRIRREESHLGGHRGSHPAHIQPQASGRSGIRVFFSGGGGAGQEGLQLEGQILFRGLIGKFPAGGEYLLQSSLGFYRVYQRSAGLKN